MNEKYIPIQPIKKGVEVTTFAGKTLFEVVKPRMKRKMAKDVAQFLDFISRN